MRQVDPRTQAMGGLTAGFRVLAPQLLPIDAEAPEPDAKGNTNLEGPVGDDLFGEAAHGDDMPSLRQEVESDNDERMEDLFSNGSK